MNEKNNERNLYFNTMLPSGYSQNKSVKKIEMTTLQLRNFPIVRKRKLFPFLNNDVKAGEKT